MNAIQFLPAQPWVERLGSALLQFLWQGVLIAAVYGVARRCLARSGPNARYLLACAALAAMAAAPVVTWISLREAMPSAVAASFTAPLPTTASVRSVPVSVPTITARVAADPLLPWVVAFWLLGAMAFWTRLIGGWIVAGHLRSRLVRPAPREWQQTLDRLTARVRVARPVRMLVSALVQAPAVVGWLRPVLLVPAGALAGLLPEQVEALLVHELAHIRRHDYLVNMLQSVVEALLFYHPAVWWVSSHIRAERELCCDDVAVSVSGDALAYVRALAELESARSRLTAVMAATGGSLAHRIARLLGNSKPVPRSVSGPGILAVTLLLLITAIAVFGQAVARPTFEIASIKPSSEQRFQMVRPQPGRLTASASLRLLMQNAYSVQPFQIVGGPDAIMTQRYEIEAKTGANTTRADMFLMLQSLLEERFHLQIHRESKEQPVYALVASRSGIKLPAPKDGSCVEPPPDAPNEWAGGRIAPPGQGPAPTPRCGSVGISLAMAGPEMRGGKIAMPELVRVLAMVLGRGVVDRTGYTGLFDVRLAFQADEATPALPPPPPGAPAPEAPAPSIFAALQEQLGLRLESAKGPVDVIVIDRVERPSTN